MLYYFEINNIARNERKHMINELSKNDENRIQELICELSESRGDERDTQSQILQVISIMGTILGILFGTSSLLQGGKDGKKFNQVILCFGKYGCINITPERVIFLLSVMAFLVAFLYVTYLGIINLLRHYHIQFLQDRLHELIKNTTDDKHRDILLHWNEYISPICTKNIRHISCIHAALSFFVYVGAIAFIILFSVGILVAQFLNISNVTRFDKCVLYFVLSIMGVVFVLFFHLSLDAKNVAQYACDMAHKNQKVTNQKERYAESKIFRYLIKYFLYPKRQDLQKPFFIILSYVFWIIYSGIPISRELVIHLTLLLFVFDFLVYQARYQINDIRGIKEDQEAVKNKGLKYDNNEHMIQVVKYSTIIAFIKICLAVLLSMFLCPKPKFYLLLLIILVVGNTIIYEFVKLKEWNRGIFFFVGMGYSLRFFLGFVEIVVMHSSKINLKVAFCLVVATWAYGSFSCILAWTNEVLVRMEMQYQKTNGKEYLCTYIKSHYKFIESVIKDRFSAMLEDTETSVNNYIVLRRGGRLNDPWNVPFIISILSITMLLKFNIETVLLEIGMIIGLIMFIKENNNKKKKIYFILTIVFCIGKIGVYFMYSYIYVLFTMLQLLFIITYFILLYKPQIKKMDIHKTFLRVSNFFLGKYATDLLIKKNNM